MEVVVDAVTPLNAQLSAKFKRSFAYTTVTDRLPIIVTGIIDSLSREKNSLAPESNHCNESDCSQGELKQIIGFLSELKYQIQTAKPLTYLSDGQVDSEQWNNEIKEKEKEVDKLTFYSGPWLFVECYLYRRINDIFSTKNFITLDPFYEKKKAVLISGLQHITPVTDNLRKSGILDCQPIRTTDLLLELTKLLKYSLWANRLDLSLTSGNILDENNYLQIEDWNNNILVDETEKVINVLFTPSSEEKIIDFVLDNAGLELLCDLCLADFLISRCKISKIRFRVKRIPWFVSDVTVNDFTESLSIAQKEESSCGFLAHRWQTYLDKGIWSLHDDTFWCLGLGYDEMPSKDPVLYKELETSSLAIFKGDLNYRKLLQDKNWPPTESFASALGRFHPCPLVALRTNKADTIVGLPEALTQKISSKHSDWLVSGNYGLIQFDSPLSQH